MDDPTSLDYWTLAIAVTGALTGAAALAAQVWGLVLSGPRVKVGVANSLSTRDDKWFLSVDVSNVGRLPVTLVELGVTFRAGGKWLNVAAVTLPPGTWDGPALPHRLADAEAATWLLGPATVAGAAEQHGVTDVRGYVRLATGKRLRSGNAIDVANLASFD